MKEIYQKNSRKRGTKHRDYILILKGRSSSTPSILNSTFDTDEFDGGGIYVNYHGVGIVIDPGYHFVRNLHHYGLSVFDIDIVIITHEHIDHNNDMRLIDDLNASVADTHKILWLMDAVSYEVANIYRENSTGFLKEKSLLKKVVPDCKVELTDLDSSLEKIEDVFQFEFFRTEHIYESDNSTLKKHTFGCSITFLQETGNRRLVYTSDTRYFEGLSEKIKNADIVIANISGIYEDDYMLIKPKNKHLGYYGCYSILKECYEKYMRGPQLFMISEFWNGQNDIRFDVTKQLYENIMKIGITETKVIPAEKGMFIQIADAKLKCSQCGMYCDKYIIQRPSTLSENVKVVCAECGYS